MPSTISSRSVDAPTSAGKTCAGRRFANRPSSLRMPQQAALGAPVDRQLVPFRTADRAEQHRARAARERERLVGERRALRFDRRAADQRLLEVERNARRARGRLEHAARFARHLGADSVPGQNQDSLHV